MQQQKLNANMNSQLSQSCIETAVNARSKLVSSVSSLRAMHIANECMKHRLWDYSYTRDVNVRIIREYWIDVHRDQLMSAVELFTKVHRHHYLQQ